MRRIEKEREMKDREKRKRNVIIRGIKVKKEE